MDLWLTSNLAGLGCHFNVRTVESQRRKEPRDPLLPDPTPFSTHNGNGAQGCVSSTLPSAETVAQCRDHRRYSLNTDGMKSNVLRNNARAKSGMNSSFTLGENTSQLKARGGGGGGRLAGRRSPSVRCTQIWGLDVYKV